MPACCLLFTCCYSSAGCCVSRTSSVFVASCLCQDLSANGTFAFCPSDAPFYPPPLIIMRCLCRALPRPADAKHYASEMLGQKLITKQTGEDGLPCDKVHRTRRYSNTPSAGSRMVPTPAPSFLRPSGSFLSSVRSLPGGRLVSGSAAVCLFAREVRQLVEISWLEVHEMSFVACCK